ncbi:hypothetical protein EON65_48635 [archaeon]|nr:MAG: hypothetical protein EON65_48635 [archaeon]
MQKSYPAPHHVVAAEPMLIPELIIAVEMPGTIVLGARGHFSTKREDGCLITWLVGCCGRRLCRGCLPV